MNLGLDNLRDLLEDFLSNSGGRRGRERENRRQEASEANASADASAPGDRGNDEPGTPADDTGARTESGDGSTDPGDRPDADDLEETEVVDDLYHRIENLQEEIESNDSQLGTIQESQQQVADQVEQVDDTVRQLLGIYDQMTNDVNPFTGEGEGDDGFGVFGEETKADGGFGVQAEAATGEPDGAEETVSFADLKDVIEDAAEGASDDRDGETIEFDEEEVPEEEDTRVGDDTRVEVQATESVDDADAETDDESGDDVTLESIPETFASDVIIFEWLTDLVRTAGPAATLRAISYYHEIGWIEDDVKQQLESVLSGPDLDIHVDPGETPEELTAEDHADSYTYIMKLNAVHETKRETDA